MDNRFRVQGYVVRPLVTMYGQNYQPAILLVEEDDMLFANLTVNLEDPECDWDPMALSKRRGENVAPYFDQYVDTNNLPGIEDILKDVDWCKATGQTKQSGFCTYPMYRFYSDMLECCQDFRNWWQIMNEFSRRKLERRTNGNRS